MHPRCRVVKNLLRYYFRRMGKINNSFLWGIIFASATWSISLYLYWLLNMSGEAVMHNGEKKMAYRLVNTEEKDRIKNNDKSIAALEGKDLLYDAPGVDNKFSGNMWKYHRNPSDYQKKMLLKEKFAKQMGMKPVKPDKILSKKN